MRTRSVLDLHSTQLQLAANQTLLIDVREATEFAHQHIAGAYHVALSDFCAQLDTASPPRDVPLVLCCAAGNRSQAAMHRLSAVGYANLAHIDGRIAVWKAAGLPLAEGHDAPCPRPELP